MEDGLDFTVNDIGVRWFNRPGTQLQELQPFQENLKPLRLFMKRL